MPHWIKMREVHVSHNLLSLPPLIHCHTSNLKVFIPCVTGRGYLQIIESRRCHLHFLPCSISLLRIWSSAQLQLKMTCALDRNDICVRKCKFKKGIYNYYFYEMCYAIRTWILGRMGGEGVWGWWYPLTISTKTDNVSLVPKYKNLTDAVPI